VEKTGSQESPSQPSGRCIILAFYPSSCTYSSECWAVAERYTPYWCSWSMVSAKAVKNQMVPSCAEWWCETENQATASEPHLSTIVQARRISLFSHIARMPDETEAKKILIAPPLANGPPSYYTDEDHKLSRRTWNPILTSPWMKQLKWLRIVHSLVTFGATYS